MMLSTIPRLRNDSLKTAHEHQQTSTLTEAALDAIRSICTSFVLNTDTPAVPEVWKAPDSIQAIIASWANLEPQQAYTLSRATDERAIKVFSYRNRTLEKTCRIFLTRDGLASPVSTESPADAEAVMNFMSGFHARLPASTRTISKAANPWVFVDLFLPPTRCKPAARVLGACFWSFLCIVDDLTEDDDKYGDLDACLDILSRSPYQKSAIQPQTPCLQVMRLFQDVVRTMTFADVTKSGTEPVHEDWKLEFWKEVHTCCAALKAEQCLRGRTIRVEEWMAQRIITISTRPFLVLFRTSLHLPCDLGKPVATTSNALFQLQSLLQALLGLQNDILGWEKDHRQQNPLNAIEILISQGVPRSGAFRIVMTAHNDLMRAFVALRDAYVAEVAGSDRTAAIAYVDLMTTCGHAMAEWMMSCGRYIVAADVHELR